MAIIRQRQPIHLVSLNKHICLWNFCSAYISNARIVKTFKLVNGIKLHITKKYNPTEVFVDSNNSDTSNISDHKDSVSNDTLITHELVSNNTSIMLDIVAHQTTDINVLNKLCMSCFRSQSTKIIKSNKIMTNIISKLEKVHIDL